MGNRSVKALPTRILVHAGAPVEVLLDIQAKWGQWISVEHTEGLLDACKEPGYLEFMKNQTPGSWISGLRDAHGLTQKELGEKLGGVSPARISDWERDRREISKDIAKKLSKVFNISADHFL